MVSFAPNARRVLGKPLLASEQTFWRADRNIETTTRHPLGFHYNDLLWVPLK
jgi:hypothetical protein